MKKPENTLSQLEEEPITGFYSCTYTELVAEAKRSVIVYFIITVVLTLMMMWQLAALLAMPFAGILFFKRVKNISKNREGKPLKFSKHMQIYKSKQFIQPAIFYQRERNYDTKK